MRRHAQRHRVRTTAAMAVLLATFVAPPAAAANDERVRPLTDLDGNPVLLHGLNTASNAKDSADAMPEVSPGDVRAEKDRLDSNAVRLLIFWSKVEPRPGVYDESYLDQVAERVSWYRNNGMRVVLDMHQDLWGPETGTSRNNGAPAWASHFDGLPVKPNEDNWALTYLQPGVVRAFDHFWGTSGEHPELQEHYAAAWKHVAQRFAGDRAVLGYDLMNEPWGGSVPWPFFERNQLGPMYQRVIDAIREVDDQHWTMVEPQALGVNQALHPSSLPDLDDPRPGPERIAYAPHLYPLLLESGQDYTGAAKTFTRGAVDRWFRYNTDTARRLNAPMVLGEFGLDATKPGALDYVDAVRERTREAGASWMYWSNDPGPWAPRDERGDWAPLADHLDRQ